MTEWNTTDKPVFAIGDIHGHVDRLEALLKQEGLVDRCRNCDGAGQVAYGTDAEDIVPEECIACDGFGWARCDDGANHVVLIGDVGHFGVHTSPMADFFAYQMADLWADTVLWGNHDRAVVQDEHAFRGYMEPKPETKHLMRMLLHERKLKLAFAAHGFLFTHAGLHVAFENQKPKVNFDKNDPVEVAAWLNVNDEIWFNDKEPWDFDPEAIGVRDAIGRKRGGRADAGGILWRDVNEKLYTWSPEHPERFRQVFGHSADGKEHKVRYCGEQMFTRKLNPNEQNPSYCIDVGGKGDRPGDNCLAGIWIGVPGAYGEERIVRVDLNGSTAGTSTEGDRR